VIAISPRRITLLALEKLLPTTTKSVRTGCLRRRLLLVRTIDTRAVTRRAFVKPLLGRRLVSSHIFEIMMRRKRQLHKHTKHIYHHKMAPLGSPGARFTQPESTANHGSLYTPDPSKTEDTANKIKE
jgi:hypothetical protein